MAVFEDHCRDTSNSSSCRPRGPTSTAASKRAQSSCRYEFYASYDLPGRIDKLQPLVDAFAHQYNHHRPHQALGDLTPAEYLSRLSPAAPVVSYVLNQH
jgi:transposase InsO family protein